MTIRDIFIAVDDTAKTIVLKPNTTLKNIFVKLYLDKGYTIKEN